LVALDECHTDARWPTGGERKAANAAVAREEERRRLVERCAMGREESQEPGEEVEVQMASMEDGTHPQQQKKKNRIDQAIIRESDYDKRRTKRWRERKRRWPKERCIWGQLMWGQVNRRVEYAIKNWPT
jgi:hypothetical protein